MSTQPTDVEIDALWRFEASKNWDSTLAMRTSFTRAVLARWGQPAHSGEPVAWLDPWTGTKVTTDYDAYGKHGIPLYTAPKPVEREPLTRQQLREAFYNDTACTLGGDVDFAEKVCRVVEKAHGIKGGQHGAD